MSRYEIDTVLFAGYLQAELVGTEGICGDVYCDWDEDLHVFEIGDLEEVYENEDDEEPAYANKSPLIWLNPTGSMTTTPSTSEYVRMELIGCVCRAFEKCRVWRNR